MVIAELFTRRCTFPVLRQKLVWVTESSFDLSELKDELLEWEKVYNTIRPYQALEYLTPLEFLEQYQ